MRLQKNLLPIVVLLIAGCTDKASSTQAAADPLMASNDVAAEVVATKGPQVGIACPSQDLTTFVAAFAEDPAIQKAFTADPVETAFVDMSAQPEPAESVKVLPRDKLLFPVMPNRAQQLKDGLKYREVANEGGQAIVVLEIPDTDAQVLYTFRRDACWSLVKIVDPAFDKTASDQAPAAGGSSEPAALIEGKEATQGLSKILVECMSLAGSQNIPQAECLTDERNRQDARLNKAYKALTSTLQGESLKKIIEAQKVWFQLQQKDGAFETLILDEHGPMGSLQQIENEARAIAQRAELLEKSLEISKL
jgi:uncharacterized protein YecT (DUF1311 family)